MNFPERCPIAVVFALREEIKPILAESTLESEIPLKPTVLSKRSFRGASVVFCQTGIGISAAHEGTVRLLKNFRPDLILSAGYAGGADRSLRTGDLLIPTELRSETPADRFPTDPRGEGLLETLTREEGLPYKTGPLVSLWKMAGKVEKTGWGEQGAMAVDMESAAVASVAVKRKVPFLSLRVVFDTAEEEIFEKSLKSILRIPRLLKMHRLCQRNLAQVLGRFLTCRGGAGE